MPQGRCVRGPLAGLEHRTLGALAFAYIRDSRHLGDYRWMSRLGRWRWSKLRDDEREEFVEESGGAAGGTWGSDQEYEADLQGIENGVME